MIIEAVPAGFAQLKALSAVREATTLLAATADDLQAATQRRYQGQLRG
ncbi:hypothetical protein [Actinoplanes sp. NPDC049118]